MSWKTEAMNGLIISGHRTEPHREQTPDMLRVSIVSGAVELDRRDEVVRKWLRNRQGSSPAGQARFETRRFVDARDLPTEERHQIVLQALVDGSTLREAAKMDGYAGPGSIAKLITAALDDGRIVRVVPGRYEWGGER